MRVTLLLLTAALASACSDPPERLVVENRQVIVLNDTHEEWRDVEIWVNNHYRAAKPAMAPGERLVAPLHRFVAGFGQTFGANQQVTGVQVTARDASGDRIELVWGEGRR